MYKVNDNYLKLPGSYLFAAIGKKVNTYADCIRIRKSSAWALGM